MPKPTFGMLTLDQKSSRCSRILSGLYLEYRIASSVNIPMCARSRPEMEQKNQLKDNLEIDQSKYGKAVIHSSSQLVTNHQDN